jgi:ketosteroid isomerase-like protein
MTKKLLLPFTAAALLLASACTSTSAPDTKAEETTLRDLDVQWSKAAASHDLNATVSYYSDDASVLPPNAPVATTKEAIRAAWGPLVAPDVTTSWQATKFEVAHGGDMAYAIGTYKIEMKPPDTGKFVEVWKKQADGKWKCVADIFNSDLPLPAPAK